VLLTIAGQNATEAIYPNQLIFCSEQVREGSEHQLIDPLIFGSSENWGVVCPQGMRGPSRPRLSRAPLPRRSGAEAFRNSCGHGRPTVVHGDPLLFEMQRVIVPACLLRMAGGAPPLRRSPCWPPYTLEALRDYRARPCNPIEPAQLRLLRNP